VSKFSDVDQGLWTPSKRMKRPPAGEPTFGAYVDYGVTYGSGHASRQIALASAWRKFGGDAAVVVTETPTNRLKEQARELGVQIGVEEKQFEAVVVDSYVMESVAREKLLFGRASLELDDFSQVKVHHADVLLDQNFGAGEALSGRSVKANSLGLYGPRFALLRPEFCDVRPEKEKQGQSLRIGLFMGGMAKRPLIDEIASRLRSANPSATIIPVSGSIVHVANLMTSLDLAVSAGGSTLLELAACGVPTLSFPVAANQQTVIEQLIDRDLGFATTLDRLEIDVQKVVKEFDALPEISRRLSSLVDGHGASRVAAILGSQILEVREVTERDSAMLFEWANDSQTRSNSFTREMIAWSDHQIWLASKLGSPTDFLFLVTDGETPLGHVRFSIQSETAEISVNLNPAIRGRRFGARVIRAGVTKFRFVGPRGVTEIHARIRRENTASRKAFDTAGFVFRENDDDRVLFVDAPDSEIKYFRQ
jgi:UDP-2,4-diacetamido-2,4,6-trideoxy-beta-L-altropyranose hydrolase